MKKIKVAFIVLAAFLVGGITAIGLIIHFNNKQNTEDSSEYMAIVVMEGFELDIPNKYMATLNTEGVLMYWVEDDFYINITVSEGSYKEEVVGGIGELQSMMAAELEVKKPYREFAIEGNSYVYMLYEDEGLPIIHGFKEADDNHVFEIVILCYGMEMFKPMSSELIEKDCEELIIIADTILSTARTTDKDNTYTGEIFVGDGAYEDYYNEMELYLSIEYVDNDTILYDGNDKNVKYGIEGNFYLIGEIGKDNYSCKVYSNDEENIIVRAIVDETMKEATDLKLLMEESSSQWGDAESSVEEVLVGEHTYYYYTYLNSYLGEDGVIDEYIMIASTRLSDGAIYRIELKIYDEEQLDINRFIKFLDIKKG